VATTHHPVRLVVTDDLARNRLTVFFRLILAIPHFIWLGLFSFGALIVWLINWVATIVMGRSPRGLHTFLAAYVRYVVHLSAYISIAADPWPPFYTEQPGAYAVDLAIDPPAKQNRWVSAFRPFLALPALFMSSALSGGSPYISSRAGLSFGVTGAGAFLSWFSSLARGRSPQGLRDAVAWGIGYSAQTWAYVFLLTDRYPVSDPFHHLSAVPPPEAEGRPRLANTDDLRRSRLTVFFRLLFAFPHIAWLILWSIPALLAAFANWIVTLVRARPVDVLVRFLGAYVRYYVHVSAYLHLLTERFPGFTGEAGGYEVEVRLPPTERQNRWVTGFRIFLAIPAMLMSSVLSNAFTLAAIFGWFVSLALGRMPPGFQSLGAYVLGYEAQLQAYLFVLTDRYPHASPAAVVERP
jgi:hypothetical protein